MSGDKVEYAPKPSEGEPWDVAIVGSGPAGLTAAIYTTRGAASTLLMAGEKWGGQLMLTTTVDNYPGFPEGIEGPDLMMRMRKQTERFGAEFVEKNVEGIDFDKRPFEIAAAGQVYKAKSIILATGAETKWMEVPGEEKLRGRGVSSCAPCDAPFFKDKNVMVVGGGDSAMEEALVLTKYSPLVTIIHRRDEFRASKAMQKKVFSLKEQGKIRIIWDTEVLKVLGDQVISGAKLKTKPGSNQANKVKENASEYEGKILEENQDGIVWEMPTQGLFVAIGHIPATEVFSSKIEVDEKGYIVVHEGAKTSVREGVFVAGDVHDYTYRQAVTAAGYGCQAGMEALKFLEELEENKSR
jgi:thioredoxin reductase (NADPH)